MLRFSFYVYNYSPFDVLEGMLIDNIFHYSLSHPLRQNKHSVFVVCRETIFAWKAERRLCDILKQ